MLKFKHVELILCSLYLRDKHKAVYILTSTVQLSYFEPFANTF